jgi:hypothetical protein
LSAKGQAGFVKSGNLKLSGWALWVLQQKSFRLGEIGLFLEQPKTRKYTEGGKHYAYGRRHNI